MTHLVNAVGGGDLGVEVDLPSIAKRNDILNIQYDPEVASNLCFQLSEEGPTIILYRTGAFSIAGANSIQDLRQAFQRLREYIAKLIIYPENSDFEVRYLVFKSELGYEIDLNELYEHLNPGSVEYEPEQFPQLKYDPENHRGVFMISRTGSIIYTGDRSRKNAKDAIDELRSQLRRFG
ncbi:hypothetical protein [Salinigranum marinum]|uniref:hypothetical protein n=1 Tax=Salinigranum marinum TaxID=1515595 RepID=UPI002989BCA5|nr:hypothetical protein [Salinigranum marinum]